MFSHWWIFGYYVSGPREVNYDTNNKELGYNTTDGHNTLLDYVLVLFVVILKLSNPLPIFTEPQTPLRSCWSAEVTTETEKLRNKQE